jgi:hypothetical protein
MTLTVDIQLRLKNYKDAGDAGNYYKTLSENGHDYGNLAYEAATDSGFWGQYANNFLENKSLELGISIDRNKIMLELMDEDYRRREENDWNPISTDEIRQYHYKVFERNQLARSAWTGTFLDNRFGPAVWCQGCNGVERQGQTIPDALQNLWRNIVTEPGNTFDQAVGFFSDALGDGVFSETVADFSLDVTGSIELAGLVKTFFQMLATSAQNYLNIAVWARSFFLFAKNWVWPRDPIILDLDGNGLETVGLAANIHFDHDGDGVLTKTGWAGKNDALLVWDRNTNGSIDTGAELFGDFTMLPNGTLAPNGFAALAALDSNGDGVLDANDPAFAELKIWRDADQNGKTGTGELISLLDAGIVALNLANTLKNQNLPNGNQLTREGSFTRADGSTAAMGEFQLATDTFDTKFAQEIEVPEALKSLPNMDGSGNVRQLQQAAVQSDTLASLLEQFQGATTRAEQRGLLDQLVSAWADTSGMAKTLSERVAGKYVIQYDAFGNERRSAAIDAQAMQAIQAGNTVGDTVWMTDANGMYLQSHFRTLIAEWNHKLHVLEAFNGQYFFNLPTQKSQTHGANWGLSAASSSGGGGGKTGDIARQGPPTLVVNFSQVQLDLLQQAYDSLKESVYASLVMQTRLKPYLDQMALVIDEAGIRLDAGGINQMLANKKAADPEGYLADLLELDKYANQFLSDTNWSGLLDFDSFMANLEPTTGMAALLAEFKVRTLTTGDDQMSLGKDSNFVLAGDGNDRLYGNSSNDKLFGEAGNDQIFGGNGNDLISGGAGDDLLYGGAGADMYVFGRGFGHDTIVDAMAPDGLRHDMVRFIGLNSADVRVERDFDENLIFTIVDTGETLSIPGYSQYLGTSGVGRYIFDDGTVWSHEDALRATVALATDGDDVIHGSSAGDKIFGQAGHDTLVGNGGDDVFDGGADNDVLIGASAGDWVLVGDEEVYVANTMPIVWANGNDTYLFGRGDGQDTVIDGDDTAGNTDTLSFKDGVLPADVKLTRADDDLVLAIRGTNDQVTIKNYFIVGWNGSGQYWHSPKSVDK